MPQTMFRFGYGLGIASLVVVAASTPVLAQSVDLPEQRLSTFSGGPALTLDVSNSMFSDLVVLSSSADRTAYQVEYGFPRDFATVTISGQVSSRPPTADPDCP